MSVCAKLAWFFAFLVIFSAPLMADEPLHCDAVYEGLIDKRGVDDFISEYAIETSYDGLPAMTRGIILCLDSPGGSFIEAIRLYNLIETSDVITYVPYGADCLSACALTFLAGGTFIGQGNTHQYNARILGEGGKLGFHAPYTQFTPGGTFSSSEGNEIFSGAVRVLSEANSIRLRERFDGSGFNDFLFSGFISTAPSELFEIESVSDAILANIEVRGLPFVNHLNSDSATRVCDQAITLQVLEQYPDLTTGGVHGADLVSRVRAARQQRLSDNLEIDPTFLDGLGGETRDQQGSTRVAWVVQGYPSSIDRNADWTCLVEMPSDVPEYFSTWSRTTNFLSVESFSVTVFETSRDASRAAQSYGSLEDFRSTMSDFTVFHRDMKNWAALPADTPLTQ